MFDFSTMYTNILHPKLKSVMGELINFYFPGADEELFGITRYGTIWTNNQQKYKLSFNKTSLKLALTYKVIVT